ncbi:MAG: glycosyltransferase family 4 protein [Helicobacter sp.]|nr:glycosyltransferase family 4 protein [Helicobacter sp.]
MKIVFLSHLDMNLYLFRLPIMQELVKRGHEVIALCPEGEYFARFAAHGIVAQSYAISRKSLNPFREIATIYRIARCLRVLHPDIVQTFTIKPNVYGAIAAKIVGVPCAICTVTGLGSFYIQQGFKTFVLRMLIESLNKLAFLFAKAVVFQNKDDLQLYYNKGLVSKSKAVLIKGSGINPKIFARDLIRADDVQRYKDALGIMQGEIVVLMVARAIAHKGVVEYYQAAKKLQASLPHVRFLFVGDVDNGNIAPLSAEFLRSNSAVHWLGKREDIFELLACADIFVLPSYREGIPRTLLEAGSMALPIVTTDAVGCREVVDDGRNGFLVPVGDSELLAQKIAELASDSALREAFGHASRKKILAEFSVDAIVAQHLALYERQLRFC